MYSLYTFVAIKPTYTSNEKRKIGINDFPGIMICPDPPYDMDALVSRGFGGAFTYFVGSSVSGWAGNKSEDVKKVRREVSTLKSTAD